VACGAATHLVSEGGEPPERTETNGPSWTTPRSGAWPFYIAAPVVGDLQRGVIPALRSWVLVSGEDRFVDAAVGLGEVCAGAEGNPIASRSS
jgi:hypothetical protein